MTPSGKLDLPRGNMAGRPEEHGMRPLSPEVLGTLRPEVAVPRYDRPSVSAGIVHLGVGGFHRAHQAAYLDALLSAGGPPSWGVCGVGVLPHDRRLHEVLRRQGGLYTLVLKHSDGARTLRVVGSLLEHLLAPDDPRAVVERLADPATRIVTLTVTEGGYVLPDEPPDARPAVATAFSLVTDALAQRRQRGAGPFTIASCDNIEGNGDVARHAFTSYARRRDAELADWIEQEVRFPSSMVDRITPVTSDADRAEVQELIGVQDGWPVVCEPYTQWVLEDDFVAGRPAFEEVGVQLVRDVRPYELMKLRLLNASHQALGYLGLLAGYQHVHEVARDPLFATFVRAYMDDEATPTLPALPGVDLEDYKSTLVERFANPEVRDTLPRICADTSDRIPTFLLPVTRELLAAGRDVSLSALVVASWARYAEGVDEQGRDIDVVDRWRDQLTAAARRQRADPLAFLQVRQVFGDLADDPRFRGPYLRSLASLHARGARATVQAQVQVRQA
jgi:mannitol 2-dehydrogenase